MFFDHLLIHKNLRPELQLCQLYRLVQGLKVVCVIIYHIIKAYINHIFSVLILINHKFSMV